MTASERLRALWESSADNPEDSLRLANATLCLADVVEAAEELEEDSLYETWLAREAKVRRALLALEEHLDGGEE